MVPSLVEIDPVVLENMGFFHLVNFCYFCYYLPFEKGIDLQFITMESILP